MEQLNSVSSSDPSTSYIDETAYTFAKVLLELSTNFKSLDFQIKIARLIVELSKFRIRNFAKVVSLENLPQV